MVICKSDNDAYCMAMTYRHYGFFMVSNSVSIEEEHYREFGFIDKGTSFDDRYFRAVDYFI
jgi:hypothetical protein